MASTKSTRIDFSGVDKEIRKGGMKAAHVPEGDYLLKIVEAELRRTKDRTGKYISWRFTIVSPAKYKGKTVYDITSLKPDALWNLRNLIHAATNRNVAGKAVNFNPESMYGKVIAATLEDDEYTPEDGPTRVRSRPADYRPKAELNLAGDEDEEEDEDEYEDEEEEEDEEEDEDEEDEPAPRSRKRKTSSRSRRSSDDEEDEDLEDVDVEDI